MDSDTQGVREDTNEYNRQPTAISSPSHEKAGAGELQTARGEKQRPGGSACTAAEALQGMRGATPELCQLIDSLIGSSAVPVEATLSDIRAVVIGDGIFVSGEGELLHPQDRTFLVIELDELIERHGMQAAARDFTARARA